MKSRKSTYMVEDIKHMNDKNVDKDMSKEQKVALYNDIYTFLSYAVHDDDLDKEFLGHSYPDLDSISELFSEFYNTGYFRMGYKSKAEDLDRRISRMKLGEKLKREKALQEAEEKGAEDRVAAYMDQAIQDLHTSWDQIGEEIKASAAPGGVVKDAISVFVEDGGFGVYSYEDALNALEFIYGPDSIEVKDLVDKGDSAVKKAYTELMEDHFLAAYEAATGKDLLSEA